MDVSLGVDRLGGVTVVKGVLDQLAVALLVHADAGEARGVRRFICVGSTCFQFALPPWEPPRFFSLPSMIGCFNGTSPPLATKNASALLSAIHSNPGICFFLGMQAGNLRTMGRDL